MEDIDSAPFEVLSSLVPLMESRRLLLPNRPAIPAADGFRLFGTRTTRKVAAPPAPSSSPHSEGDGDDESDAVAAPVSSAAGADAITGPLASFVNSWCRVAVSPLPNAEVRAVVTARHPRLPSLIVDGIVATCKLLLDKPVRGPGAMGGAGGVEGYHARVLSVRNVLRWAARVDKLARLGRGLSGFITEQVRGHACGSMAGGACVCVVCSYHPYPQDREHVLLEAFDVFAAHWPTPASRLKVAHTIASAWGISQDRVGFLVDSRKPPISVSGANWVVGRVSVATSLKTPTRLPAGFAPTRHALCLLERLAAGITMAEPMLLVGGTWPCLGEGGLQCTASLTLVLNHRDWQRQDGGDSSVGVQCWRDVGGAEPQRAKRQRRPAWRVSACAAAESRAPASGVGVGHLPQAVFSHSQRIVPQGAETQFRPPGVEALCQGNERACQHGFAQVEGVR